MPASDKHACYVLFNGTGALCASTQQTRGSAAPNVHHSALCPLFHFVCVGLLSHTHRTRNVQYRRSEAADQLPRTAVCLQRNANVVGSTGKHQRNERAILYQC